MTFRTVSNQLDLVQNEVIKAESEVIACRSTGEDDSFAVRKYNDLKNVWISLKTLYDTLAEEAFEKGVHNV